MSNTEKTQALLEWGDNYEFPSPASLFLDLIGWSGSVYGEPLVRDLVKFADTKLGYLEIGMLGEALEEYSDHPQEVYDFVDNWLDENQG